MIFRSLKKLANKGVDVFEKLASHLELSVKAAELVEQELDVARELNEVESLTAQVIALEKRGDELAAEITSLLTRSALPLTMHSEFGRLLDMVDDVLDELYFIASEISRGRRCGLHHNNRVKEVYRELAAMSSIARLAVQKLHELTKLAFKDVDKAGALSVEIDAYEDRVDEMRNSIMNRIYECRNELDTISLFHLIEITRAIDRVVDTCKDVAHTVLSIVTSVLG